MTLAVLQLSDPALQIQAEDGPLYAEQGFAHLQANGVATGEAARALAWLEPQASFSQYWCRLNQVPLAGRHKFARHHADLAFAQLKSLWGKAGQPENLIVLAPGNFTDDQLDLLLGMLKALPCKVRAVMDSALAACLDCRQEVLFIDVQLHQTVSTRCRSHNGTVHIAEQDVIPDLGLMRVQKGMARFISDLLIRDFRHDPLHSSESEQYLHDRLPGWIDRLVRENEVAATLATAADDFPFVLNREDLKTIIRPWLRSVQSAIQRRPGIPVLLSHTSAWLTGVLDTSNTTAVAAPAAGIENCLKYRDRLPRGTAELYRLREFMQDLAGASTEIAAARLATHLLHQDRALPLDKPVSILIDAAGVRLSNRVDDDAALTVVLKNNELQVIRRAPAVAAQLPQECRPGASIIVDEHPFRLIEVAHG